MENEKVTVEKEKQNEDTEQPVEARPSKVRIIWHYSSKVIRSVCFFLILGVLLSVTGYALMPKNNSKESGMENEHSRGFYSEPDGSIDVFFLGNSNTYAAFSPIEMWRAYGIQTYTSGVGFERVVEAYTVIKDLLEFHHPKVIVLETDCIFSERKGTDSFGETFEKILYHEMPIFQYHDRWKTVYFGDMFKAPDYTWHSYSHGQYVTAVASPYKGNRKIVPTDDCTDIDPISHFYLNLIVSLCRKNNIELMFVCAPCTKSWNYSRHNGVQRYADEKGIDFIDFNLLEKEIKLNWAKDTRDKGTHLNVYGAKKVSTYIGRYLVDKYKLPDLRSNKELAKQWDADYKQYNRQINATKAQKPEADDEE